MATIGLCAAWACNSFSLKFLAAFILVHTGRNWGQQVYLGWESLHAEESLPWLVAQIHQCSESVRGSSIIKGGHWVGGARGS